MKIIVPIISGAVLDESTVTAVEIEMDVENGQRIMDRLYEKDNKLIEQHLETEYIIIDRKSYMDLCAYNQNRRAYVLSYSMSMWINTMCLSSGEVKFIVLPQDKTRIQLIPKTEDVLFRMSR